MLTGQCKNDFELWMFNYFIEHRPDYPSHWIISKFERKTELEKLAFYMEWFDSVGIYIIVDIWHRELRNNVMYFGFSLENKQTDIVTGHYHIKSRQEATKDAIEKANELYNDKFK